MNSYKDDVLYHYGIKGQKHGRRRYQNYDGSLTAAGRARYADGRTTGNRNPKEMGMGAARRVGYSGIGSARVRDDGTIVSEANRYGAVGAGDRYGGRVYKFEKDRNGNITDYYKYPSGAVRTETKNSKGEVIGSTLKRNPRPEKHEVLKSGKPVGYREPKEISSNTMSKEVRMRTSGPSSASRVVETSQRDEEGNRKVYSMHEGGVIATDWQDSKQYRDREYKDMTSDEGLLVGRDEQGVKYRTKDGKIFNNNTTFVPEKHEVLKAGKPISSRNPREISIGAAMAKEKEVLALKSMSKTVSATKKPISKATGSMIEKLRKLKVKP